jgi:hypothetical protein
LRKFSAAVFPADRWSVLVGRWSGRFCCLTLCELRHNFCLLQNARSAGRKEICGSVHEKYQTETRLCSGAVSHAWPILIGKAI